MRTQLFIGQFRKWNKTKVLFKIVDVYEDGTYVIEYTNGLIDAVEMGVLAKLTSAVYMYSSIIQ